ncbi:hypothetical protein AAVH_31747 [Aphelenchoides avenae]|nr:hypothetical protein AAVH_31747 [Aphelenchus avenae]
MELPNTEEYVFGDALEEVQRREQTPPDATHYQVTLVKLLFYTKYHVQYGELPQSCDFLKGKVPDTEHKSVNGTEQCSILSPWKASSGTENSLLSLLA